MVKIHVSFIYVNNIIETIFTKNTCLVFIKRMHILFDFHVPFGRWAYRFGRGQEKDILQKQLINSLMGGKGNQCLSVQFVPLEKGKP